MSLNILTHLSQSQNLLKLKQHISRNILTLCINYLKMYFAKTSQNSHNVLSSTWIILEGVCWDSPGTSPNLTGCQVTGCQDGFLIWSIPLYSWGISSQTWIRASVSRALTPSLHRERNVSVVRKTAVCAAVVMSDLVPSTSGHVGPPLPCNFVKLVDIAEMNYFAANGEGEVSLYSQWGWRAESLLLVGPKVPGSKDVWCLWLCGYIPGTCMSTFYIALDVMQFWFSYLSPCRCA